jgi:hypothetical protein
MYQRELNYDLKDVTVLGGGPFSASTVLVERFDDARPVEQKSRRASWGSVAVAKRDNDDWYCTSDDRFKEEDLGEAIARVIARHIEASKLFGHVISKAESGVPDYVLSGKIETFEACRQREVGKEVLVAQMGLIGMAIAAGRKVPYDASVVLGDLLLMHAATSTAVWQGTAVGNVKGEERIDPYGWTVFDHARDALKLAAGDAVEQMGRIKPPEITQGRAEQ